MSFQNLDKTILDLIAHGNSGVWCVSVVQLVALVYKVTILITDMEMANCKFGKLLRRKALKNDACTDLVAIMCKVCAGYCK